MPTEDAASVKLYHPRGPLVVLSITAMKQDFAAILANVTAALDAGFLVHPPGLERGETRLDIVAVARMSKENRDRSESPMIALYEHGNAFKSLLVYLDTEEQVAAFQYAAKCNLTDIPLLDGTTAPERGKSKSADAKIYTLAKPMGVIVQPNPRYSAEKAANATQADPYTVPKLAFVRWADQKPAAAAEPGTHGGAEPSPDDAVVATWVAFLKADPSVPDLNKRFGETYFAMNADLKKKVWAVVQAHAKQANLRWSKDANCFVVNGKS